MAKRSATSKDCDKRRTHVIPVLLTLSLLRDDDGTPVGVATIAKDLTLQKEAETELKRMSKVFMDAADPIIIEDTHGYVIEMNDEAVRVYGYSRDDAHSDDCPG